SSQRDRAARIAAGRREGRKVSRLHRRSWNVSERIGGILTDRCSLESAEEEQPVLCDRSADRSTKLVALDTVTLRRECVSRIENAVTHELKRISVKRIRSRLGQYADG